MMNVVRPFQPSPILHPGADGEKEHRCNVGKSCNGKLGIYTLLMRDTVRARKTEATSLDTPS